MLEIGLGCDAYSGPGASLALWKQHFGPQLKLEVLELAKDCASQFVDQVNHMWIGSQSERALLKEIVEATQDDPYGT